MNELKVNKVSARYFIEATRRLYNGWKLFADNVTYPIKMPATCYMGNDDNYGFAVGDDGELRSLFSLPEKQGMALVKLAVEKGATWLTCYDNGFLVDFYKRCGFDEVGREANYVEGYPDVVRMAWRQ